MTDDPSVPSTVAGVSGFAKTYRPSHSPSPSETFATSIEGSEAANPAVAHDPYPTIPLSAEAESTATSRNQTRFRMLRWRASGGLGEGFVVEDTELHREVILKEIQNRRGRSDTLTRLRRS